MDYVWIRLDQKGPDNNLCAKRVCLGKSVTLHLVAAVTLHLVEAVTLQCDGTGRGLEQSGNDAGGSNMINGKPKKNYY